jgi:hypothetical protein
MPALNSVYEIKVVCFENTDQQLSLNVYHYFVSAPDTGTGATDAQIAVAMDTAVAALYKACMGNTATYRGVAAQRISPLPKGVPGTTIANTGAGSVAAGILPAQTSGLISLKTLFAGRKYRGRVYPGFMALTFADVDGKMTAAGNTAITNLRNAIPLAFTAGTVPNQSFMALCIWHRSTATFTQVGGLSNLQAFATQRRRGQSGRLNVLPF